jgi:hypothetical protein
VLLSPYRKIRNSLQENRGKKVAKNNGTKLARAFP